MIFLELIASITLLLNAWLLAKKDKRGFWFGILSNLLWFTFAFLNAHYIQACLSVIFVVVSAYGIKNWSTPIGKEV